MALDVRQGRTRARPRGWRGQPGPEPAHAPRSPRLHRPRLRTIAGGGPRDPGCPDRRRRGGHGEPWRRRDRERRDQVGRHGPRGGGRAGPRGGRPLADPRPLGHACPRLLQPDGARQCAAALPSERRDRHPRHGRAVAGREAEGPGRRARGRHPPRAPPRPVGRLGRCASGLVARNVPRRDTGRGRGGRGPHRRGGLGSREGLLDAVGAGLRGSRRRCGEARAAPGRARSRIRRHARRHRRRAGRGGALGARHARLCGGRGGERCARRARRWPPTIPEPR